MSENESKILSLADSYKVFEKGGARLVYIQNSKQQPYPNMFGFWDFSPIESENAEVFEMLHLHLKRIGAKDVVGPINYCTWLTHRIAMDNFDAYFYPDRQGSDTQNDFLKGLGYNVLQVSAATLIEVDEGSPLLCREIKMPAGISCKRFSGDEVAQILPVIYGLSKEIFGGFALYSPLSYDDYLNHYIGNLSEITPDVSVIFDKEKPIGYVFGYVNPDKKCYIGKTMGVLESYRSIKMTFLIINEYIHFIKKYNAKRFAFHYRPIDKPIVDSNIFGSVVLKKNYGLYYKKMQSGF